MYSSNQNGNSVSVINIAHCHAGDTAGCDQRVHSVSLAAGASPQGIAIDTATGTVYVANIGNNTISVINTRTCSAVDFSGCGQAPASVTDPRGPIALAVDQATDTVYVADTGDNFSGKSHTVTVINGATCNGHQHAGCAQTPPTVQVGHGPDGVAVDQATHTVYAVNNGTSNNGHTVSVINAATCNGTHHTGCGQTPATIQIGQGPFWIAVDQATHTAYTANFTDSTVSVINTATCNAGQRSGCGQRTPAVPVGFRPWALAIDPALHTVYVINNWDDTLSAINAATCQAADTSGCGQRPATSQVGEGPQAVVVAAATRTVYAANFVDSTVSVINAAACSAASTRGCRHPAPTAAAGPPGRSRHRRRAAHRLRRQRRRRYRLGHQHQHLQCVASHRLRAARRHHPGRQQPRRDRHRPGHRHRLRHQQRRRHRLGHQRCHLQRLPALRLRPDTTHHQRRYRAGRDRGEPGHQHGLRR